MTQAELAQVREYFAALSEAEGAAGGFYSLCFEFWPEEELWGNLALEEARHAETVLAMLAAVEARPEEFSLLKPLQVKPVRLFAEGIRAGAQKVRSGAYGKRNALAFSADLERSIIESRYEALLRTGDEEYRIAVQGLKEDTGRHAGLLAARLASVDIVK